MLAWKSSKLTEGRNEKSPLPSVTSRDALYRGLLGAFPECSLVDVGRKERLAAWPEAALASEVTLGSCTLAVCLLCASTASLGVRTFASTDLAVEAQAAPCVDRESTGAGPGSLTCSLRPAAWERTVGS